MRHACGIIGLLCLLACHAQAQHVIAYSLHGDFALPEMSAADVERELSLFERTWEEAANVDLRRVAYPNGVRFISGRANVSGGRVALGLAYIGRGEILIHNGTRHGGRTDYWRTAPGLLGAVCAHELWHIVRGNANHSADRNCLMHVDLAVRKFCPAEVAALQQMYGPPKPLDVAGTFRIPAANARFVFGDGGYIALVGLFDGKQWGCCLYHPPSSAFMVRYTLTPGLPDVSFQFGPPNSGYQPLAGDWDFDGKWTIGLYDPRTSRFLLKNSLAGGKADQDFVYGGPQSQALNHLLGTYQRK